MPRQTRRLGFPPLALPMLYAAFAIALAAAPARAGSAGGVALKAAPASVGLAAYPGG